MAEANRITSKPVKIRQYGEGGNQAVSIGLPDYLARQFGMVAGKQAHWVLIESYGRHILALEAIEDKPA